jgi:sarcosine oxidase gamma subunit
MAGVGPADASVPARLASVAHLTTRIVRLLSRALRRGPVAREASSVAIGEVIGGEPESDPASNSNSEQPAHGPAPDLWTIQPEDAHDVITAC